MSRLFSRAALKLQASQHNDASADIPRRSAWDDRRPDTPALHESRRRMQSINVDELHSPEPRPYSSGSFSAPEAEQSTPDSGKNMMVLALLQKRRAYLAAISPDEVPVKKDLKKLKTFQQRTKKDIRKKSYLARECATPIEREDYRSYQRAYMAQGRLVTARVPVISTEQYRFTKRILQSGVSLKFLRDGGISTKSTVFDSSSLVVLKR